MWAAGRVRPAAAATLAATLDATFSAARLSLVMAAPAGGMGHRELVENKDMGLKSIEKVDEINRGGEYGIKVLEVVSPAAETPLYRNYRSELVDALLYVDSTLMDKEKDVMNAISHEKKIILDEERLLRGIEDPRILVRMKYLGEDVGGPGEAAVSLKGIDFERYSQTLTSDADEKGVRKLEMTIEMMHNAIINLELALGYGKEVWVEHLKDLEELKEMSAARVKFFKEATWETNRERKLMQLEAGDALKFFRRKVEAALESNCALVAAIGGRMRS